MTPMLRRFLLSLSCIAALLAAGGSRASVVEERISVPVKVENMYGKAVAQEIEVTLFHENSSPRPRPLLVLNHGRAGNAAGRAGTRTSDYAAAARWLSGFGFLVAVPIRIGYGRSGGEDVEDSGRCASRNFPPVYHAAAVQTLAVLEAIRKRPDAAKDRAVVVGQSFGGATSITLAGLNPSGLQAAINFAGGGGGDPVAHPGDPCSPEIMKRMYSDYGRTARVPTLWLYSVNDQYWGQRWPRDWFEAFKAAGGRGEFAQFPAVGTDGHRLFSRGTELWQPRVHEFLASIGYVPLVASTGKN